MRLTTILSAITFLTSIHVTLADSPTIGELIELSGVATGPSEYNEEGYQALAALREAAHIPTPTAPQGRSVDKVLERMTNAERLANGLPLKSPKRRSRASLNRLDPRITPVASPVPPQSVSGLLTLRKPNGQLVGYVRNIFINDAQTRTTTIQAEALRATVTFNPSQATPNQVQVTLPTPAVEGYPLLSLVQGRDNTNQNVAAGSFHYLYLAGSSAPGSGPGSLGVSGQNTYSYATGVSRISQTDVWTFDRSTGRLIPTWVNDNSQPVTFDFYAQGTGIYGLVDPSAFGQRYPSPLNGPYYLFVEAEESPLGGGQHPSSSEANARRYFHTESSQSAMTVLSKYAVLDALHNSDARLDAPECFPGTRKAVQQSVMGWIRSNDKTRTMLWLHGPARSGKTAIAGSIAEICEELGILAGSFFFSASTPSRERSSNRGLVATLVYSLLQHDALSCIRESILGLIEHDPSIFRERIREQCIDLLLKPFHEVYRRGPFDPSHFPKIIIIDGIDEVESQDSHPRQLYLAPKSNAGHQFEVLAMLLQLARDPTFPFRILVVSRRERVIEEFFSRYANGVTRELRLDEKGNPDSDIALFLRAQLSDIRRRHQLPSSWADDEAVDKLVANASGNFVYAATAIRFLGSANASPEVRLDHILGLKGGHEASNPFARLDALYTHIIGQSSDPIVTVKWISAICYGYDNGVSAFCLQHILEEEVGQAEVILGEISSLLRIPPSRDLKASYRLHDRFLVEFLRDSSRSGSDWHTAFAGNFFQIRFARFLLVAPLSDFYVGIFWAQFLDVTPIILCDIVSVPACAELLSSRVSECNAAWWTTTAMSILYLEMEPSQRGYHLASWMAQLYRDVHFSMCNLSARSGCLDICKNWREAIHKSCTAQGWSVPDATYLLRERMHYFPKPGDDLWREPLDVPEYLLTPVPGFKPSTGSSHATDYVSLINLADTMFCCLSTTWQKEYLDEFEKEGVTEYNVFESLITSIKRELEEQSPPPRSSNKSWSTASDEALMAFRFDLSHEESNNPPFDPAFSAFIESLFS
ncbi:hypothetical protein NMY22_g11686 [Coprinellus aureogranulatus]|nr:hypothetical protein NMY22_g11686 [Coprinellus aureogranulatus]